MSVAFRQDRARGQPNQIVRVGQLAGFVHVVDAPDQTALAVAPRAEVIDVEIADARDGGRLGERRADRRPQLHPPIKRSAQENKGTLGHPLVFEREILPDKGDVLSKPLLVAPRGADDVHAVEYMALDCFHDARDEHHRDAHPGGSRPGRPPRSRARVPSETRRPANEHADWDRLRALYDSFTLVRAGEPGFDGSNRGPNPDGYRVSGCRRDPALPPYYSRPHDRRHDLGERGDRNGRRRRHDRYRRRRDGCHAVDPGGADAARSVLSALGAQARHQTPTGAVASGRTSRQPASPK